MFYTTYAELCHKLGKSPSRVAQELNINKATVTYWKNNSTAKPGNEILCKIAEYFSVSTDYLLGNASPQASQSQQQSEEIAKVALFGGDKEVSDEMWNEVKNYVEYIKQKHFKE